MTVGESDNSLTGFLNRAADIGLGFLNRNNQPKPAPAPKPPKQQDWIKWVAIGLGVVAVGAIVLRLIKK